MKLTDLDWLLFVFTSLCNAALLGVLVLRRRWKAFPFFTVLIGFEAALNPLLYVVLRYATPKEYWYIYWISLLIEFVLELCVIWEIARIVMTPTGTWVRDAKSQFLLWGAVGILIAATLPWLVSPPATSVLDRLEVRGNLFASLVVCELIAVVNRTSKSLGLGWRNHVMALGNGWTVWAVVAILVDGLHSYFGAERYFSVLEYARMFAYLGALSYWSVQFWLEEPARKPISPELSEYIQALHRRIKMDLDSLDAQG